MKSVKDFRISREFESSESKRSTKLSPNKKSGKERHSLYSNVDDDEIELDYKEKRESAFDYFDDEK